MVKINDSVLVEVIVENGAKSGYLITTDEEQFVVDFDDTVKIVHRPVDGRYWCLEGTLIYVRDDECPDDVLAARVG